MSGHLFITHGDLTSLACDAWALPTDAGGWVSRKWIDDETRLDQLVGPANERGWRRLQSQLRLAPGERTCRLNGWACGPHDPEPWLVDTAYRDVASVLEAVLSFVEQSGARASSSPRFERQKPLLGVPLVGTGAGGQKTIKGDLIEALVRNLHGAARAHDVDIALVTSSEAARAAAIAARRRTTPPAWPTGDPRLGAVVSDLAHQASQRHLVIFAGAGLGRGAALPLWEELLEHLASEADLTADERGALKNLDEPDRAALLDIGLKRANKRLGDVVASRLESRVVGLAHTLLATLPTSEAATTNYDDLFERACSDVGRPLAVLPGDQPAGYAGWILKMHGTVSDPPSIVLTRGDYLAYFERRGALAGVVEAMLLTRHMLFVGFSLRDENFQRIVHQVRNAIGDPEQRPDADPFGTAILFGGAGVMDTLWRGDLRCVDVDDTRAFELLLDALADRCTDTAAFLLSPHYEGALTREERIVRRSVMALRDDPAIQTAPVGQRVLELLAALDREQPAARTLPMADNAPAYLSFTIGSGLGSHTTLELRADGRVHYEFSIHYRCQREIAHAQPSQRAWRRLRQTLQRLGAQRWQARYEPLDGATDGEGWSLHVAYGDGFVCYSQGYIAYPPHGDIDHGRDFRQLLTVLSDIVGGRDVGGVRSPTRPSKTRRAAAVERAATLLGDGARLEASLPRKVVVEHLRGQRSVNWLTAEDHAGWPKLRPLLEPPWPAWDARGVVPTADGIGIVLVRLLGHPSDMVASARELERAARHFEHGVEELKKLSGAPEDRAWLGTYVDFAIRFYAVIETRHLLDVPVHGFVVGIPGEHDDDSPSAWRRAFGEAWRTLAFDRLRNNSDALGYTVAGDLAPTNVESLFEATRDASSHDSGPRMRR